MILMPKFYLTKWFIINENGWSIDEKAPIEIKKEFEKIMKLEVVKKEL